jgi:hypothetical protein
MDLNGCSCVAVRVVRVLAGPARKRLLALRNYITQGLNISVGIMPIKPITLQTTAGIRDRAIAGTPESHVSWSGQSKQMRGLPQLDTTWQLPADSLRRFPAPWSGEASRPQVLKALLDDRQNISALILALYQVQWEAADPSWSIRRRPDILATLCQIGFERSKSHAAPRSNRFGQRVLEATRLPWLQQAVAAGAARVVTRQTGP